MWAGESCVTTSNAAGDLLFYSDGMVVHGSNDQPMPNGSGLLCNSGDWQQGVATCPWPGQPGKHLLFHTDIDHTLYWSVVDMTLNAGIGDVTNANTFLTNGIGEAMSIARHPNGTDYWLVVRAFVADIFQVYPITSIGVGGMVSSVACDMDDFDFTGMVRFNNQHTWMAATMRGGFGNSAKVGLFPFNAATGVLSPGTVVAQYAPWAFEFSCDGSKLYLSHNAQVPIEQYDMLAGSTAAILGSAVDVSPAYPGSFDMVIAPDKRIYFVWDDVWMRGRKVLGAIMYPSLQGSGCTVVDSAVVWTDPFAMNMGCLPNFMQPLPAGPAEGCASPDGVVRAAKEDLTPALSTTRPTDGTWLIWPLDPGKCLIEILSTSGQPVHRSTGSGGSHWLDVTGYAPGLYVVRTSLPEAGRTHSLRFVKQ